MQSPAARGILRAAGLRKCLWCDRWRPSRDFEIGDRFCQGCQWVYFERCVRQGKSQKPLQVLAALTLKGKK